MTSVVQRIWQDYQNIYDKYGDRRTEDWFLVSNLSTVLVIEAAYLYFSLSAGPRFMRDRKPFELKNVLSVYNLFQVLFCFYMVFESANLVFLSGNFNYTCEPVDYSNNPKALKLASLVWMYYFNKVTELLDTVFFILRKKNNQVTTLHVYHHATVMFCAWMFTRFVPGGHAAFTGWLNAIIHVIMYSYYFLAGLGPRFEKYLWWKKHLTKLQLAQFVIAFLHNFSVLFRECSYPRFYNVVIILQCILFFYMFSQFYIKSYGKKGNDTKKLQSDRDK